MQSLNEWLMNVPLRFCHKCHSQEGEGKVHSHRSYFTLLQSEFRTDLRFFLSLKRHCSLAALYISELLNPYTSEQPLMSSNDNSLAVPQAKSKTSFALS